MSQGLGLMDIEPQSEDVKVSEDKSLKVFGISFEDIIKLLERFPDAQNWISGTKIDPKQLLKVAPGAIAAVIAAACGLIGDEKAEKRAAALSVETQLDALEAIARLTFRSGFGPFVQRIAGVAMFAAAVSGNSGKAPDTNLQPASKPSQPSGADPTTSAS